MIKHFLKPYSMDDASIYPGRLQQAVLIQEAILSHPLVVIHGAAGTGKTSLLNSQIASELINKGSRVCIIHIIEDPLEELRAALYGTQVKKLDAQQLQSPILQIVSDSRPNSNSPLVIIFDPLESLLELKSPTVTRKFLETISSVLHPLSAPNLPYAHVVFVLRSEFLPKLYQVAPQTLGLDSAIILELPNLTPVEAQLALQSFMQRTGFQITPELQPLLIKDYLRNRLRTVDFQILLRRLYEDAVINQKQPLLAQSAIAQVIITTNQYRALGGIVEITQKFLEYEIDWILQYIQKADAEKLLRKGLLTQRSVSGNLHQEALYRHAIRLILANFVTISQASTPSIRRSFIQRVIAEGRGITRQMLYRLLVVIEFRGLLYQILLHKTTYLLVQSSFTSPIRSWIEATPMTLEQCKVQDQLRLISSECKAFNRIFHKDEIERFSIQPDRLALSKQELTWAFISSVVNKIQPLYWYKRFFNDGLPINELLDKILKEATFQDKIQIIQSFYKIGTDALPWLYQLLADDYPQVRAFAIGALEKLNPLNDWRNQHLIHDSFVPAGEFVMGIHPGIFVDESLEHTVTLRDFYICKATVTLLDYRRFLESKEELFDFNPKQARHPMVNISWFEAVEYASWANARLPSEAEWEKAASWHPTPTSTGIQKRHYPWGNQLLENRCNMSTSKINQTTEVGRFSKQGDSAFGCMDMAGNVWEWTNTIYKPYPYSTLDGRENLTTTGSRVIRGGSYESGPSYVTTTVRQSFDPYSRRKDLGFRCVLMIPDADQW